MASPLAPLTYHRPLAGSSPVFSCFFQAAPMNGPTVPMSSEFRVIAPPFRDIQDSWVLVDTRARVPKRQAEFPRYGRLSRAPARSASPGLPGTITYCDTELLCVSMLDRLVGARPGRGRRGGGRALQQP